MSELLIDQDVDPFAIYNQISADGDNVYAAGFPSYPANFSRDTLKAGILSGRSDLLASQLEISARHQGTINDPLTGEQPGKIHHEMPGTQLKGRGDGYTTYNSCDATPLFLIGAEGLSYIDVTAYESLLVKRKVNLLRAADHIVSLIGNNDNLYWDNGPLGKNAYTLRVTYWKDSILPHTEGKQEPVYPVTYSQAHFMAARALLSASRILEQPNLAKKADDMFRAGIKKFIQPKYHLIYKDSECELRQESSDELHSLAYIPTEYENLLPLDAISHRAEILATPYGYMCTPTLVAQYLPDKYHGDKIWIFEQAKIHYGTTKFGLLKEAATARAIAEHIGSGQELFGFQNNISGNTELIPEGNDRQLWSVAAAEYFAGRSFLNHKAWL